MLIQFRASDRPNDYICTSALVLLRNLPPKAANQTNTSSFGDLKPSQLSSAVHLFKLVGRCRELVKVPRLLAAHQTQGQTLTMPPCTHMRNTAMTHVRRGGIHAPALSHWRGATVLQRPRLKPMAAGGYKSSFCLRHSSWKRKQQAS